MDRNNKLPINVPILETAIGVFGAMAEGARYPCMNRQLAITYNIPVASNEKHDESGYMSAARSIKRHYTGTRDFR